MKKRLVFAFCLVLLMATSALAGNDIMAWSPRTPAGGGYVPDPMFWYHEAMLSQYGERVIQFYAPPITTNYYTGGQLLFGGNTNFISGGIDQQSTVGTTFTGTGSVSTTIQK